MRSIASITTTCLLIATATAAFAAGVPTGAASTSLAPVLVEVHPNPTGIDAGAEWFELSNPAPVDLPLDGWAVTDDDACFAKGVGRVDAYAFALDGLVVPAGGRLVVTLPDAGGCLRLGNADDNLALVAPGGHAVQRIAWGAGQDVAAPKEGRSVAACALPVAAHGAWTEQAPTPGDANAACVA